MDPALIAAGIAAVTSLVINRLGVYWSQRQRQEERRLEAKVELGRHRKPLLEAAQALGARIDNLQHSGFDAYFTRADRREIAIASTLYRFARYFATLEILRSQVTFLELEDAAETKAVAALIVAVENAFASDSYGRFMLWREEQRAIGEVSLVEDEGGALHVVGFAAFVADPDRHQEVWLDRFRAELGQKGAAAGSKRLASVQRHLQRLVRQLDEEGRYADPAHAPAWLNR